jgi:hypothetical protein
MTNFKKITTRASSLSLFSDATSQGLCVNDLREYNTFYMSSVSERFDGAFLHKSSFAVTSDSVEHVRPADGGVRIQN